MSFQVPPAFDLDGYCVVDAVLDADQVSRLRTFVSQKIARDDGRGGVRNLLEIPEMRRLADGSAVRAIVNAILGPSGKAVRGILFDKTSDANWKVPWHQDVTISVAARSDLDGYGPWSVKIGVTHVQPPASVLEKMISVRIHLDDCPEENGALKVIPGSHRLGKIAETQIARLMIEEKAVVCEVKAGGVLLMRPLLAHSSSAAVAPRHRRVIHFDFAAVELPSGLEWAVDREPSS